MQNFNTFISRKDLQIKVISLFAVNNPTVTHIIIESLLIDQRNVPKKNHSLADKTTDKIISTEEMVMCESNLHRKKSYLYLN